MKIKIKKFTLACIAVAALTSTLATYAQDQKEDRKGIEVTFSNDFTGRGDQKAVMFTVVSITEAGKKQGICLTIESNDSATITIPSDTIKLDVSSAIQW